MRSVSGGNRSRVASRTGVRAVPATSKKKPATKIAPGRRRNAPVERGFGRRSTRPTSAVMRWLEDVREGSFGMQPFKVATIALIAAVGLYGLFVGGHVAAAGNEVANRANKVLALAGFSIDDVTVSGRSHADSQQLLAALGIKRGDPIFGFDTEAARQRVERVDWVKSATVTRLLPDAIRIDIVERKPFAVWQRGGALSVVDSSGRPITDENVQAYANLPFIVGFGGAREAEDILTLMAQAQPQLLSRVRAFVRVGSRRWNLRLENGVDVKLPEVGIEKALADIVALDAAYKIFSRDIESVDLRLPDRVSVALTPEAAGERGGALAAKISAPGGKTMGGVRNVNGVAGPAKVGSVSAGGNT
ncbi:MAG: cell division protein FtsQ/DivIB [Parvibaculum sp.]|uniref:cell division protein FtsQ/DivIB n=1 Tax=Parvibaculum sp. TaxID=2024848 RepID=UPI003C7366C4